MCCVLDCVKNRSFVFIGFNLISSGITILMDICELILFSDIALKIVYEKLTTSYSNFISY